MIPSLPPRITLLAHDTHLSEDGVGRRSGFVEPVEERVVTDIDEKLGASGLGTSCNRKQNIRQKPRPTVRQDDPSAIQCNAKKIHRIRYEGTKPREVRLLRLHKVVLFFTYRC